MFNSPPPLRIHYFIDPSEADLKYSILNLHSSIILFPQPGMAQIGAAGFRWDRGAYFWSSGLH